MNRAQQIVEALGHFRFRVSNEQELQKGLWRVLQVYPDSAREVILDSRSRIDFLVGDVGIEVKVDGTLESLVRQITRYAQFERIGSLVVISTRVTHRSVPGELFGKPVYVSFLGDKLL